MASYFLKKFTSILLTLWVIITATFFLMKALPGDPFTEEKGIPKEILRSLHRHYGLDKPLLQQYLRYLFSVLQGDLGPSFKYKTLSVNEMIKEGFPVSMSLGLEALFLSLSFGLFLGAIAALKHRQWQDHSAMIFAVLGLSIPSFILASLFQYIFALQLKLFPIARWESFSHTILPAFSLSMLPTAFIARLTRSSMLDTLSQDYIKTAKAKGLSSIVILYRHALPNALLPILAYLGPLIANILTGSFVIERIFAIPGMGQWFVSSIQNRDYTAIMGTTIFYSALLLLCVFLIDLISAFIDPRIKLKESS